MFDMVKQGVFVTTIGFALVASPVGASPVHSGKKVACPQKGCLARYKGFGKMHHGPGTTNDDAFSFLTGQHFRVRYYVNCHEGSTDFNIARWAFYGGQFQ